MNASVPAILACLVLVSCNAPQTQEPAPAQAQQRRPTTVEVSSATEAPKPPIAGPTAEQAAEKRARPYVEGMAALEQFRSTGCDARAVLKYISELQETVSLFHRVGSFPQYEQEARDRHTSLAFAFADEALSRDCLDSADKVYRDLFTFYVGATYSGIRDRAKLGIDDVRARRATTASDTK